MRDSRAERPKEVVVVGGGRYTRSAGLRSPQTSGLNTILDPSILAPPHSLVVISSIASSSKEE